MLWWGWCSRPSTRARSSSRSRCRTRSWCWGCQRVLGKSKTKFSNVFESVSIFGKTCAIWIQITIWREIIDIWSSCTCLKVCCSKTARARHRVSVRSSTSRFYLVAVRTSSAALLSTIIEALSSAPSLFHFGTVTLTLGICSKSKISAAFSNLYILHDSKLGNSVKERRPVRAFHGQIFTLFKSYIFTAAATLVHTHRRH